MSLFVRGGRAAPTYLWRRLASEQQPVLAHARIRLLYVQRKSLTMVFVCKSTESIDSCSVVTRATRPCMRFMQALAAGKPAVLPIVVYDLPSRDCAALASNGELEVGDLPQYKTKCVMEALSPLPTYK